MSRCLQLAKLGEAFVAPNPMVGCVIVHNNQIVAEGYHQKYGESHAEVNAFNNLADEINPKECEVFVSLEPCSHFGKTPPCADLIIAKQPKRVVVGMLDPNPQVAGSGIQRILEAGIEVKSKVLESECQDLNKKFVSFHSLKSPFVTLKWAETYDGYMGRQPGNVCSKKISSEANNAFVHQLRANHMAILIGANTAIEDNPKLDIRHWLGIDPVKVILSKNVELSPELDLFKSGKTIVFTDQNNGLESEKIISIQPKDFSIETILNELYQQGIYSVLVEGGALVLQGFINSGMWNEAIRLISNEEWGVGVAAPRINSNPSFDQNVNGDRILKYYN
jgi:diaminohydroxyphosphoribosylaminopyrimidine deaminase/5-amino-6-(5-phosphoribosylamino)uracil reductase